MSFDLSEFLTEGLINSVNNRLIPSDLATVYAGNYLVKSLITQTQVAQVSDAIAAYKTAHAQVAATVDSSKPASSVEAPVTSAAPVSSAAESPANR